MRKTKREEEKKQREKTFIFEKELAVESALEF